MRSLDGRPWSPVQCDTRRPNRGRNVFEGWATSRTTFDDPGGRTVWPCGAVAGPFEIRLHARRFANVGPRAGSCDGARDVPRDLDVDLWAGPHDVVMRVRDCRAAGGGVGPTYLARYLSERIF